MQNTSKKLYFVIAGIFSFVASALHIGVIIGGASWYRFFGAGEELAHLADNGSYIPAIITFAIAGTLFVWGLYAFSGAGMITRLPFLKVVLCIITAIYLLRGLSLIPLFFFSPELIDSFVLWSSFVCIFGGLTYTIALKQNWSFLS